MQTKAISVTIKKLPASEIEIEGEIEAGVFEGYYNKALKKVGEHVKLDGFRTGKVPESVLKSKIPEIKILEEMAEMALSDEYPKILEAEKLDVISRPQITITKLARNNPLGFKIKTAVLPDVKLPDYKSVAKKAAGSMTEKDKDTDVTEEDVTNTILDIRRSRAPKKHVAEGEANPDEKDELPNFDDEFVRSLGPFENVEDFKDKLKINIKLEKENQLKEKTRLKMIEKIIDESKIDLPSILIDMELDKILYRMESDITQMGLKFEDYLKHLNKTVEDLRKEFHTDAQKKAKLALVLNEIAKVEKLEADAEEVAKEVAHILEHYKEADPERATMHAQNVLTNEKVFKFLEEQQ